ncbi:MAG: SRPBCC domain-containing protein [Flavobacterium sp.]|uniref:SRPBCC family protein n=1 Tax=Flavobacterium sp. TaxID=239 RepID=UPI00120EB651|nr:SRPBCC domain-containing protein [Flavobacterium sp.]RZJ67508.1 MAG: SRPBCC domain-containing protein [Flavobacterium sp.]
MLNFDWTKFTLKIPIKANIQTLYDAWSKSSEVEKWFLEECIFMNSNVAIAKNSSAESGNAYRWRWFVYDDIETGKVTSANGKNHFQFTFAGDCVVDVKFSQQFEHTVVEITQSNIPTDDASKKNIRLGCHDGWRFYLYNLKSVYEGGIDLRNKDDRFPPMINN